MELINYDFMVWIPALEVFTLAVGETPTQAAEKVVAMLSDAQRPACYGATPVYPVYVLAKNDFLALPSVTRFGIDRKLNIVPSYTEPVVLP